MVDQSVISFYRYSLDRTRNCIVVCNFTPLIRNNYIVGVNEAGTYSELLNSDDERYGGSGQGNQSSSASMPSTIVARNEGAHSRPASLALTLPPLAVLILEQTGNPTKP